MKQLNVIAMILLLATMAVWSDAVARVQNPSFETGTLGQVPTNWQVTTGSVGPVTCTHEAWSVNTHYFEGSRSMYLHSRAVDGGVAASQGCSTTVWSSVINSPAADSVKFRIRGVSVTHTTYWGWLCYIYVLFTDGVNFAGYPIFGNGEVTNFNNYDYMATGADGSNWYVYAEAIPANIDRTNMQIAVGTWAGLWTWYGYYSDLKCNLDMVELVLVANDAIDSTVDITPYFDWGAISSYPGLAPPGNMGIWCPPHNRGCYFPSDSLTPGGSYPKAWLIPGRHLATDYGPANVRLLGNPMVVVPDRNSRLCSLFVEVPSGNLIDDATDLNVIQISAGESKTVPIGDTVETAVFLANCDGWAEYPGGPSPDQPLEVRLNYGDGTADTVITDSIHPAGRLDIVNPAWIFVYGNEVFVCDPAYFDTPSPYYDPYHSEAWHWYTLYPDTSKLLNNITFVGIQSGTHAEVYISAVSYNPYYCCNHDGIRGDADYSMTLDVGDLTYLVAYLFQGGPPPPCPEEGDVDGSGAIDVGDLTYLVAYLFQGGPPPVPC